MPSARSCERLPEAVRDYGGGTVKIRNPLGAQKIGLNRKQVPKRVGEGKLGASYMTPSSIVENANIKKTLAITLNDRTPFKDASLGDTVHFPDLVRTGGGGSSTHENSTHPFGSKSQGGNVKDLSGVIQVSTIKPHSNHLSGPDKANTMQSVDIISNRTHSHI